MVASTIKKNKLIITLGRDVHKLVIEEFNNSNILNVPHYASYIKKEIYREFFKNYEKSDV